MDYKHLTQGWISALMCFILPLLRMLGILWFYALLRIASVACKALALSLLIEE